MGVKFTPVVKHGVRKGHTEIHVTAGRARRMLAFEISMFRHRRERLRFRISEEGLKLLAFAVKGAVDLYEEQIRRVR